jgi:two-component system cell cycle sensor histidine kinase/response regulator CckA
LHAVEKNDRHEVPIEAQKMEVLGRLAGAVIHDLNNLLTVIQLNAGLIETGGLGEAEILSSAGKIGAASSRAAELTRKVLNFARGKEDKISDVNLHELVSDLSRLLEPLVATRVKIEIETAQEKFWVRGNRGAIEQAAMNLVLNAVDAMPSGGRLRISFPARAKATGGRFVGIAVADEGEGISPDDRARVLEPFFTTKTYGTGMGLAIVDRIARSHGGMVDFDSEVGAGTEFRMWLPEAATPEAKKPAAPVPLEVPLTGRGVLLVEDDSGILALTKYLLETEGLRVLPAATGEEALELWEKHRGTVALLFTDIVLPGDLSGRDLALRILADEPTLPVLYTSGYSQLGGDQSYFNAENFLPKPFPPAALRKAVRLALSRS